MKHKIVLSVLSVLLLTISSSSLAQNNEIRYITGHIENVNNNLILLSSNLAFRANENVTAVNMTPVTFVLECNRPEGFVYIKNKKVDVVLMKKNGGKFVAPASKQDLTMYNEGKLFQIKNIANSTAMVTLSDNTKLYFSDESEKDYINKWEIGDWVIVPDLPSSSLQQLINARTNHRVDVSKAKDVSLAN